MTIARQRPSCRHEYCSPAAIPERPSAERFGSSALPSGSLFSPEDLARLRSAPLYRPTVLRATECRIRPRRLRSRPPHVGLLGSDIATEVLPRTPDTVPRRPDRLRSENLGS